MPSNLVLGAIAGAAGTVALNVATYADTLVRGRPSSDVPAKLAGTLAGAVGLDLRGGDDEERAESRRGGLGALLGYVNGVGLGALHGVLRPHLAGLPQPVAGAVLGLAATAASDLPIAASGVSDPRTWGVAGWLADLIPHLVYGVVTVAVYDAIAPRDPGLVARARAAVRR